MDQKAVQGDFTAYSTGEDEADNDSDCYDDTQNSCFVGLDYSNKRV